MESSLHGVAIQVVVGGRGRGRGRGVEPRSMAGVQCARGTRHRPGAPGSGAVRHQHSRHQAPRGGGASARPGGALVPRSGRGARRAAVLAAGAIAGPTLLVVGLRRLPGVPASLLLNLEAPLTAVLAVAAFGEHLSRRGWTAAALLAGGAVTLAAAPGALRVDGPGAAALVCACAAWALDTNLTQRLSLRDPVALVRFKGLAGGACTLLLGLALGGKLPGARETAVALAVGALGYGASIVWHVEAMRVLGAARQSALFATAPFTGALLSVPLLGERFTVREGIAAALMAAGVALLAREQHAHVHVHEPVEHSHPHASDPHHRHKH